MHVFGRVCHVHIETFPYNLKVILFGFRGSTYGDIKSGFELWLRSRRWFVRIGSISNLYKGTHGEVRQKIYILWGLLPCSQGRGEVSPQFNTIQDVGVMRAVFRGSCNQNLHVRHWSKCKHYTSPFLYFWINFLIFDFDFRDKFLHGIFCFEFLPFLAVWLQK